MARKHELVVGRNDKHHSKGLFRWNFDCVWLERSFDLFMITWKLIKNTFTTFLANHFVSRERMFELETSKSDVWKLTYGWVAASKGLQSSSESDTIKSNFLVKGCCAPGGRRRIMAFAEYPNLNNLHWLGKVSKRRTAREGRSNQQWPINSHDLLRKFSVIFSKLSFPSPISRQRLFL